MSSSPSSYIPFGSHTYEIPYTEHTAEIPFTESTDFADQTAKVTECSKAVFEDENFDFYSECPALMPLSFGSQAVPLENWMPINQPIFQNDEQPLSYDPYYETHHYETYPIEQSSSATIVPPAFIVPLEQMEFPQAEVDQSNSSLLENSFNSENIPDYRNNLEVPEKNRNSFLGPQVEDPVPIRNNKWTPENSLTNTRMRTLEEDQSLIESERKKSRLENIHQSTWTEKDTNTLILLKDQKQGWVKIAKELGRNPDDVKNHYCAAVLKGKVLGRISKESWTEEEGQRLIKYRSKGKSWREVAKLMGRSEQSASSHYRIICDRNADAWTEERNAQLIHYRSKGKSWQEIGLLLSVVPKQASEHYDVICNRVWTEEEDAQLIQSRSEGKKWMDIEKELGRDTAVLQDRFKALSKNILSNGEFSEEIFELPQEDLSRPLTKVDNFLDEMENIFQELS